MNPRLLISWKLEKNLQFFPPPTPSVFLLMDSSGWHRWWKVPPQSLLTGLLRTFQHNVSDPELSSRRKNLNRSVDGSFTLRLFHGTWNLYKLQSLRLANSLPWRISNGKNFSFERNKNRSAKHTLYPNCKRVDNPQNFRFQVLYRRKLFGTFTYTVHFESAMSYTLNWA